MNVIPRKNNVKKFVSVMLVSIIILCACTMTISAASYATGTYTVSANSGINVRKGAGTGYSKVGAASKGVTFTVSKTSGAWGYTSNIKCTNGYKSGWVSLDYCSKKNNSSSNTSSSTYSTGKYTVSTNSGINVRKGAGTNYSKIGAASKGISFNVSKISGTWGYTSSIKCTNGTKSGWVCLDYCTKNKGSSSTSTTTNKNIPNSNKTVTESGVVYEYMTVNIDTSSMENWIQSLKRVEDNVCLNKQGVIVAAKVIRSKTVSWKVPRAAVYQGPGITGYTTKEYTVPSVIQYKVHRHTRNYGFGKSWYFWGGNVVVVYTCNCGYRKELFEWTIPLPDTSDAQTTQKVIQGLPQIN